MLFLIDNIPKHYTSNSPAVVSHNLQASCLLSSRAAKHHGSSCIGHTAQVPALPVWSIYTHSSHFYRDPLQALRKLHTGFPILIVHPQIVQRQLFYASICCYISCNTHTQVHPLYCLYTWKAANTEATQPHFQGWVLPVESWLLQPNFLISYIYIK